MRWGGRLISFPTFPIFQGDSDFRRILANVDPSSSGFVTYDSFMRFMTQQAAGSESAEQLIDSFRVLANEQVSCISHANPPKFSGLLGPLSLSNVTWVYL